LSLDAGGNLQTMQAQLQTLISRKVDGIIAVDDFGAAIAPSFAQAKAAGIPVVTYAQGPGADATDIVVTQVATDFCDDGKKMAVATQELIGDNGSVAFFTGTPGNPQGAGWQTCAEEWFSENAPGITVANKSNTNWSEAGTVAATSALIASGQQVAAILNDDYMDEFYKAYMTANTAPPATFNDAPRFSSFQVEEDLKAANFTPNTLVANGHVWYGRPAVTAGVMIKSGMQVEKKIVPPVPVVRLDSITDLNVPGAPATSVIGSLLTVDQMTMALSSGS
jgi:ABC-type sugar transport system substrate-binding protein